MRRSPRRTHHRRAIFSTLGLAAAAACVVLAITVVLPTSPNPTAPHRTQTPGRRPAPEPIKIQVGTPPVSRSLQLHLLPSPLGAVIQQEFEAIQQYVTTGSAAQNRAAIGQLADNETTCEQAAAVVRQTPARPGQRAAKRYWIHGIRLQATGDRQYIAALRAAAAGHKAIAERELNLGGNSLNDGDLFSGYAVNLLRPGSAGPVPPLLRRYDRQHHDH